MLSRLAHHTSQRLGPHFGQMARGFGAYGGAELVSRVVRLATTVVIARQLAPAIVGEAALALTIFELVRVLEKTGTGQRIVSAPDAELAATCNTVRPLYWWWTGLLSVVQLLVAAVLGFWFARPVAGEMLAVLTLVYLFMTGGHIQYHLAMRAGFTAKLARISASQNIADQLLTAALLLAWPSPWSVVLPKLLTAPLWLIMVRKAHAWRPDPAAGRLPVRTILRFSVSILTAEGMATLRTQGDNLIIAATMGTSALGTYYFAFNAGLGIVSSLVGAFAAVTFPMLCRAHHGLERIQMLQRVMLGGIAVFVPLIALQALAAPAYVPFVFGQHWAFAAPLISILCLAGVPLLASTITANWLRAEGRVGIDAFSSTLSCTAALGGLYLGARSGSIANAACGLVAGQALVAAYYAARILLPAIRSTASPRFDKETLA